MLIYPAADLRLQGRRAQPWDKTTTHKYRPGQYYDFRKHPELIETHLEDFVEYSDRQAIQTFFLLLSGSTAIHLHSRARTACFQEHQRLMNAPRYLVAPMRHLAASNFCFTIRK